MKTRIFVGNLDYTATATDIRKLFEPFGKVAAAHVFTAARNVCLRAHDERKRC